LGIIYKQQSKYQESLDCFDRILRNPPSPLAHADIWFQIGHVFEQQKDVSCISHRIANRLNPSQYHRAKDAYERVVIDNPSHAKVLQQLGWLYHQDGSSFQNQDLAIQYLTKSLEAGELRPCVSFSLSLIICQTPPTLKVGTC
jgi:general transcriptional corepressor CYC8